MKTTLLTFTLLGSVIILGACAQQKKAESIFDAEINNTAAVLTADNLPEDSAPKAGSAPPVVYPQPDKGKTITRNGFDNSNIATMVDGFGNKVESRFFGNNPRVISVIVRTTVEGEKTAEIMGRNGQRRQLPPEMFNRAMTATANELADKIGIVAPTTAVSASQPLPAVEKAPSQTISTISAEQTAAAAAQPSASPSPLESTPPAN